jgi:hypothetical protein
MSISSLVHAHMVVVIFGRRGSSGVRHDKSVVRFWPNWEYRRSRSKRHISSTVLCTFITGSSSPFRCQVCDVSHGLPVCCGIYWIETSSFKNLIGCEPRFTPRTASRSRNPPTSNVSELFAVPKAVKCGPNLPLDVIRTSYSTAQGHLSFRRRRYHTSARFGTYWRQRGIFTRYSHHAKNGT